MRSMGGGGDETAILCTRETIDTQDGEDRGGPRSVVGQGLTVDVGRIGEYEAHMQTQTQTARVTNVQQPGCPSWTDHDWGGPVIHATGYVPFKGWFRAEHRTCRACSKVSRQEVWTPIERRVLLAGVNGQE